MRIKSRFKDYYDYVEHFYGGDPKIPYNREIIEDPLPDLKPRGKWAPSYNQNVRGTGFIVDKEFNHESLRDYPRDRSSKGSSSPGFGWMAEGEIVVKYKALAVTGRLFILKQEIVGVRGPEPASGVKPEVLVPWHVVGPLEIQPRSGPPLKYDSGNEVPALLELHRAREGAGVHLRC